jgi:abortive infection bacteriophage resistance protein
VKKTYTKKPKSFSEQVTLLQKRGLVVSDPKEAERCLSHLNYYRFYAYCLPFEQDHNKHLFKAGTRFEQVLNLYNFDRKLRLLLLDAAEHIEVSLRTQMAYHLSHNYNTSHPHLQSNRFSSKEYKISIENLKYKVSNSKEDFIKHFTEKYSENSPPIWSAVEIMTMGELSIWFSSILSRKVRNAICQIYYLDEKVMRSYYHHFSVVRNHAAHHARLWNRKFSVAMVPPKRGHKDLISSLNKEPGSLKNIYNTLVMSIYLINIINPCNHFKENLKNLISDHQIDTRQMGFPSDWECRIIWQ